MAIERLEMLDLDGAIVTVGALRCQKAIVGKILERGADYLVVLKANRGKKFIAGRDHGADTGFSRTPAERPIHDACDEGHGRLMRRWVFICPLARALELY
ncbi:MAG TPA: hypothetical protein VE993_20620 [Stellaceae bacterium]|nr:hypothetical protein [Stellaceae bacterium]